MKMSMGTKPKRKEGRVERRRMNKNRRGQKVEEKKRQ